MKRLLVLLAACTDYAHVTLHDGPGNVDLAAPLPHENGAPDRVELPADPGTDTVTIFAAPYIVGGIGRYRPDTGGSGEVGLEFRVERYRSTLSRPLAPDAWAITAGFAFAQWGDGVRTVAPGAFYAELNYRFLAKMWPIDVGIGPAYYVDHALGGQLTARIAIAMVRARYVANTGAELFVGAELPIPFFFGGSR